MVSERKSADISDVLATFSAHVQENYPEPETFRENLENLLAAKKDRMSEAAYIVSLERNVVFLHDLSIEGEALMEAVLGGLNDEGSLAQGAEPVLAGLENDVRSGTDERHKRIFMEEEGSEFAELIKLRREDKGRYCDQLEFQYFYLMTLRMLLFEFFNLLAAVSAEYFVDRIDDAAPGLVMSNIVVTANYYLGNIAVGEVVEAEGPAGGGSGKVRGRDKGEPSS
ncbi:MAG TPA: hypothetical protein VLA34_06840 [Candidatus Krumholzibacterium sp.]|nr:hypothetical protein [Candidatus Krumholzibacterium sp.]